MTGSDLQGDVDSKLMSDVLTADGSAFTDWYYEKYLDDYAEAFPEGGDYSVVDGSSSRASIDPVLERRYAEWIESGRPTAHPVSVVDAALLARSGQPAVAVTMPDGTQVQLEEFLARKHEETRTFLKHEAPELEALIPPDLGMTTSSKIAGAWATNSALRGALVKLGVSPDDVRVADGEVNRGRGLGHLTAMISSIPNVSATDLERQLDAAYRPPRTTYKGRREVGGRQVHWSLGMGWQFAWWARDGLVIDCSAPDETALADMIARLP